MDQEIMNPCDFCENGVSDYNGRIVCKKKYVYPSFQEYSYHMFSSGTSKNAQNMSVMRTDLKGLKLILYAVLILLVSVFFGIFHQ